MTFDLYDWWTAEPRQKERTIDELEEMAHQEYIDKCVEASGYIREAIDYLEVLFDYGDVVNKRWTADIIRELQETVEELKEGV